MSARRKGKPQQRKKIETLEPEQDFLTCGDCQREFLLSDILKFIQHKVNRCNKENVDPYAGDGEFEDGAEDQGQAAAVGGNTPGSGVINARRTSISAPIARRGTPEAGREKLSPRPAGRSLSTGDDPGSDQDDEDMDDEDSEHIKAEDGSNGGEKLQQNGHDRKGRHRLKSLTVDTGSNTINSGGFNMLTLPGPRQIQPSQFQCCSCKQAYTSAWSLLQHVQTSHGMKIYEDRSSGGHHHHRERSAERHHREGGSTPLSSKASPSPSSKLDMKLKPPMGMKRESSENSPTPKQKDERGSAGPLLTANSLHHSAKGMPAQPRPASTPPPMTSMAMDISQAPPFMFRMPQPGERTPISPVLVHQSPFTRPPHEFRMDLMNSDPFQRMPASLAALSGSFEHPPSIPGFPPPFDRPHLRPHPLSPAVPIEGSAQDFYSQRLRLLASAGNPETPASPSAKVAPGGLLSQQPYSTPPTTTSPDPAADTSPKSSSGGNTPGKVKACEFCGKCFRFQSNLIVHRRSHTGEKPFKCPMCPHACTQASKLKRHMKTHSSRHQGMSSSLSQASSMSTGSDNSMRSSSSTPESKQSKMEGEEDSEDSDSEDEERAMEEARKMGAIQDEPTDLSTPTSMAKKLHFSFDGEESNETPTDLSVGDKEARASLLSEVMEKTGLSSIQAYKEAFNQAMAESTSRHRPASRHSNMSINSKSPSAAITENGHTTDGGDHSGNENNNRASSHHESGDDRPLHGAPEHKRIKVEPADQHQQQQHQAAPHTPNSLVPPGMDTFFSRIWFPPAGTHRDLFMSSMGALVGSGVGGGMASPDHLNPVHSALENGLHSSHHMEGGSYKVVDSLVSSPKPSTSLNALGLAPSLAPSPTVSNPSPLSSVRSKEQRRNDTCEFCGKVFKNCSNLTVHRRSHTGEKPYRCQLCSYACAQSSKLTRHMKTHGRMGKDVYRCKFCNMPFSVPSTLEKHMRKCVENQNAGSVSASSTPGTNSIASADSPALSKMDHMDHID